MAEPLYLVGVVAFALVPPILLLYLGRNSGWRRPNDGEGTEAERSSDESTDRTVGHDRHNRK